MLELWIELPWSPKKKKRKKKSESTLRKWILRVYLVLVSIFVGLPLFLVFLWYLNTTNDLVTYYSYTLFPQIGAVSLEKEYKSAFTDAENIMSDSNTIIDTKAVTARATSDIENVVASLRSNFVKRNNDYIKMIGLDKKALSLNLPKNYKEFYQKRLIADTADYAAFQVYRSGQEKMLDASVDFARFENDYVATDKIFTDMSKTITNKNLSEMQQTVGQANADYAAIGGAADTSDSFSQGILDLVQHQHDVINASKQVIEGYVTHNDLETSTGVYILGILAKDPAIDSNAAVIEWYNEKMFPVGAQQDVMHEKAWEMYSDTYAFAKSAHLDSIVDIWGKDLPKADKQYSPKTASPYSG